MIITSFTPTALILSTGELTAMYTARYVGTFHGFDNDGQPISFNGTDYITNLSTDRQTAINKLSAMADESGLPFDSSSDFDLNEIKRATKEQQEEAERALRARQEALELEHAESVSLGIMTSGKHAGRTPEEIAEMGDIDYLYWLARHQDSNNTFGVLVKLAKVWTENNPEPVSEFVGVVDEKSTFEVTLKKVTSFQGMYGTSYLMRFTDQLGNIIICFTTSKKLLELEYGETVKIDAIVKKHEESVYEFPENNKVTVITRAKIIK